MMVIQDTQLSEYQNKLEDEKSTTASLKRSDFLLKSIELNFDVKLKLLYSQLLS
jgi:hypothetical protein